MLKLRIFSAVIGIPLLFAVLYQGGVYWWSLFILLGLIALHEYYRMMSTKGYNPLYISGLLVLLSLMMSAANSDYILPALLLVIILSVLYLIIKYPQIDINDVSLSFFGAFYIGLLLSFTLRIFYLDNRLLIMILSLLLTWASDTGGYFAGRLFGRKHLAPELSPNKTWEGAIGAVLLSTLIAYLFFNINEFGHINYAYVLILGVLASILAQIGDLMLSGIKRYFGVKDTGKIIPGHGGVLDRFDSFIMVVPLVYYFFIYLI